MSLIVDVSSDGVRTPVSRVRLRQVATAVLEAERVRDALVSITLVSAQRIARLNRRHLGHAGPTDVISFTLGTIPDSSPQPIVGDIYIAPAVARENAAHFGRGVREEMTRLVVHGTLHVLGYDHPDGADRTASPMWRRQERLLSRLHGRRKASGARLR